MKKISFTKLDQEIQIKRCTIPQHVSVTKNPDDENYSQIVERQNKFLTLTIPIRNKLSAPETGETIQRIGKTFSLDLLQIAVIARMVRSFYFGEIKLEDFPNLLAKEFKMDLIQAKKISQIVINKIINDQTQEEEYQSSLEKITLQEALKKYPKLADQLITKNHIELDNYPAPVRPSLKNWLADYTFTIGHNSPTAMDRGIYLFQNKNTKSLLAKERQKLAYLFKSYDEKAFITVDTNNNQIVFPQKNILSRGDKKENNEKTERETGGKETKWSVNSQEKIKNYIEPKDIFQTEKNKKIIEGEKKIIQKTPEEELGVKENQLANSPLVAKLLASDHSDSTLPKPNFAISKNAKLTTQSSVGSSLPVKKSMDSFNKSLNLSKKTSAKIVSPENNLEKTINFSQKPNLKTNKNNLSIPKKPINDLPDQQISKIEFTTHQKMPFEEKDENSVVKNISPEPVVKKTPQPMRIAPRNFKNQFTEKPQSIEAKNNKIINNNSPVSVNPKNIVNLKEK